MKMQESAMSRTGSSTFLCLIASFLFMPWIIILGAITPALAGTSLDTLIEEAVWQELSGSAPGDALVSVRLMTPAPVDALGLADFVIDPRNGRFRADVITGEGTLARVAGVAIMEVEVPVPLDRLQAGHVIGEGDLVSIRLPAFQVGSMVLRDRKEIVGKQVMRTLAAARPVQEHSIGPPIVAERGSEVTIRLDNGPISVTAPGRLLESGARGQRVRVVNNISSQTLYAYVVDGDTVEVRK